MNSVLVFTGRSAIDDVDFRWQLLRVPEVSNVFKEAQTFIDIAVPGAQDLMSYVQRDNDEYLAGGIWRELAAQLVQLGLYRRYQKNYKEQRFLIGDAGEFSSLMVCLGRKTLGELVDAFAEEYKKREEEQKSKEFLVGQRLESSQVFEKINDVYQIRAEGKSTVLLLTDIMRDHIIDQVITLGSSRSIGKMDTLEDLGVVESVVMDPLLSWLWPYLKTA